MNMVSRILMTLGLAGLLAMPAAAADYPDKPVNMVMAFSAGGSSDVQARIMQKYWNKYASQPWVFIYKPGAGGIIGVVIGSLILVGLYALFNKTCGERTLRYIPGRPCNGCTSF